jgi:hypothetical protein
VGLLPQDVNPSLRRVRDEESSRFQIGLSSVSCRWQWRDGHRLLQSIENQFQPADVASVDSIGFRPITLVADLRLARRALPRSTWRTPREVITVARPLAHARGRSNRLAALSRTNPGHFAAAVSLFSRRGVRPNARRTTFSPPATFPSVSAHASRTAEDFVDRRHCRMDARIGGTQLVNL